MRRLTAITAFALFLAVPVWAQHGGGGHGGGGGHASFGGGHSSFSGGHAGFSGARTSSPAVHSFSGARSAPSYSPSFSSSARGGSSRGPYLHDRFRSGYGYYGRPGWGCRGYGCYGYGYGYGYPYWGGGYYNPWLWDWWDSDSSDDQDYDNNLAIANRMDQQSLAQQQMWRQEEADGDQDAYAPRNYSSRPAPSSQRPAADLPSPIIPPTVLVFRDQHQQEIQNYAIVGHTLWNFGPQRTQKIPLADLDLAATQKANEDRGVTFRLPLGSEAQ